MKRINLIKYGFVRWPEEDFSDDGNRFTCYRAGKAVRVSKLVSDGDAYLSASSQISSCNLPYEVYSNLPHYKDAVWKYNGVSVESLTDDDLFNFFNACLLYEMEYEDTENRIHYPTLEEIQEKAIKVSSKTALELNKVEQLLSKYAVDAAVKFSTSEWNTIQDYTKSLVNDLKRYNPEVYPATIVGKSSSFNFVKPDYLMEENYWFKRIKEIFERYCMV